MKKAFTLAEVLITLGIIGIVAAMTMPTLIANYKTKEIVGKLKKLQSSMSQAALMAVNEYGAIDTWGIIKDDKESAHLVGTRLKPYLKLLDDCGTETSESYTGQWHLLNGVFQSKVTDFSLDCYYKLRLADGSEIFIRPTNNGANIMVDINGKHVPNVLGKDIFFFGLKENGKCSAAGAGLDPKGSGWATCNPKKGEGWNCTGRVVYKENMDYLKCADELEWNGKTKCK